MAARPTQRLAVATRSAAERPRHQPRTAFVFGGGASLAAPQAGMLQALYEQGVTADFLIGTAGGALNAAYLASRPQTVQTAAALGDVWRGIRREDVFPIHPRTLVGGLASHRDHLVPDRALRRLISRHVALARLELADVPVHVVCFDLHAGGELRLSTGPALDALLAAAAIPGVFPPVRWEGKLLVDGGIVNNTPVSHAIELGAERVYVLPSAELTAGGAAGKPYGALDAAVRAFTLLAGARVQADLQQHREAAELIVLPAPNPDYVQPTDYDHTDQLIRSALAASRAALKGTVLSDPLAA